MPDSTRVHAYLARIKDQEKDVIAVPNGAGRALCISFDKHWTFSREWDELHIIAPLFEDEGNDDELDIAVTKADIEEFIYGSRRAGRPHERRDPMVNKWSRDDLPSISDLCQADDERGNGERTVTLAIALDAVVDRLNKDFPKSYDRGGLRGSTWVERERDSALSRAETAEFRWAQMRDRAEAAKCERDEWQDRYRALQSEYARQSQAWSEQRANYEDRLARAEHAETRDPVTEKAREMWSRMDWDDLGTEVRDEYRRIATHILGQEADQ